MLRSWKNGFFYYRYLFILFFRMQNFIVKTQKICMIKLIFSLKQLSPGANNMA